MKLHQHKAASEGPEPCDLQSRIAQREHLLKQSEADINASEEALRLSEKGGAAAGLLATKYTALAEARSVLSAQWLSLVEDKRLQQRTLVNLGAFGNPGGQEMLREDNTDSRSLLPGWLGDGKPTTQRQRVQSVWFACYSIQQFQGVSQTQQQQQADLPTLSCCFQR